MSTVKPTSGQTPLSSSAATPLPTPVNETAAKVAAATGSAITAAAGSPATAVVIVKDDGTLLKVDYGIVKHGSTVSAPNSAKGDSPRFETGHKESSATTGSGSGGGPRKAGAPTHGRNGSIQLTTLSQLIEGFLSQSGLKQVIPKEGKRAAAVQHLRHHSETVQCLMDEGDKRCVLLPVAARKHGVKPDQLEFFQLTEPEMGKFQGEFLTALYKGDVATTTSLYKMELVNARNKDFTKAAPYQAILDFFLGNNSYYAPKEERPSPISATSGAGPAVKKEEVALPRAGRGSVKLFSFNDLTHLLLAHAENREVKHLNAPLAAVLKTIGDEVCTIHCLLDGGKGPCTLIPAQSIKKERFKETSRLFLQITEPEMAKFEARYIHVDYAQTVPRIIHLQKVPALNARNKDFLTSPYHPFKIWELIFQGRDPLYKLKIGTKHKATATAAPSPAEIFYKQLLFPHGEPTPTPMAAATATAPAAPKQATPTLKALLESEFLKDLKLTVSNEPLSTVMEQAEQGGLFLCKTEEGTEVCLGAVQLKESFTPVVNSVGSAIFSMTLAETEGENEKMFLWLYAPTPGILNAHVMVYPNAVDPYPLDTFTALDTNVANFRQSHTYRTLVEIVADTNTSYTLKRAQVLDK